MLQKIRPWKTSSFVKSYPVLCQCIPPITAFVLWLLGCDPGGITPASNGHVFPGCSWLFCNSTTQLHQGNNCNFPFPNEFHNVISVRPVTENETKIWCNGQARNLTWSFVLTGSQMRRGIADSSEYTLWMVMAPVVIKMFTVFCFCLVFITTVMLPLSVKFGLPANELLPGTGTTFVFLQRLIKENTIKSHWEFLCGGSASTECWLRAGRQLKMSPGMQRCHQALRWILSCWVCLGC